MGWESLKATGDMARQLVEQEASTPPTACWPCGEPLQRGPDGGLRCPADGWTPDDGTGGLRS